MTDRTANVLQLADYREAEMLRFARELLAAMRGCEEFFDGDPFNTDTMHAEVRRAVKVLADMHPRNAARLVDLALAGAEDVVEGLKDLVAQRQDRGEPLGAALATFATIIADRSLTYRQPNSRPPTNFLAAFVIVLLLMQLLRQFPDLRLRRSQTGGARKRRQRPSACSIVTTVLSEAGVGHGGEEAVRKIWERYGPPVNPHYGWSQRK